jgi:hypothetical protein
MVAGAIVPRRLELQDDVPGAIHTEPLVGNRRAGDVAAQLFESTPVIGCNVHPGMQTEAVGIGTECRPGFTTSRQMARRQLQAQHLLPRTRALRDAVAGGCHLQGGHHVIRVGDATGEIGLAIFFDKMAKAG